jgi:hypothetical protein
VTYTAGLAVIPPAVKVRLRADREECASDSGDEREEQQDGHLADAVFRGSLIDANVQMMLAPYVAQRIG